MQECLSCTALLGLTRPHSYMQGSNPYSPSLRPTPFNPTQQQEAEQQHARAQRKRLQDHH